MRFSEWYGFKPGPDDDWFDPVLSLDTELFLDPFLVYAIEKGPLVGAHDDMTQFFNDVAAVAVGARQRESEKERHQEWERVVDLVTFYEVSELCLGYTGGGIWGTGGKPLLPEEIADALRIGADGGRRWITHFEELLVCLPGFADDFISDITASMVRKRLARYTRSVCRKHGVELRPYQYPRGYYDIEEKEWCRATFPLPLNPYSGGPVLLVPKCYVRHACTLSARGFWGHCWAEDPAARRGRKRRLCRADVANYAKGHLSMLDSYLEDAEAEPPTPYRFEADPQGLLRWYDKTKEWCKRHPLKLLEISSSRFLLRALEDMVKSFKQYISESDGRELLWHTTRHMPRTERYAQRVFLGVIKHYCDVRRKGARGRDARRIRIDREASIGRGVVEFEVPGKHRLRASLEVRLARNAAFWEARRKSLAKKPRRRTRAQDIGVGYLIVIYQSAEDYLRQSDIQDIAKRLGRRARYALNLIEVDARPV